MALDGIGNSQHNNSAYTIKEKAWTRARFYAKIKQLIRLLLTRENYERTI